MVALPSQQPAPQDHVHRRTPPDAVETVSIQDGAVTSAKIADGTIASGDLNASAFGSVGQITSIDVGDAAAAGATGKIADAGHQHAFNAWPPGSIILTGRTTADTGWLLCDGAAVSRTGATLALFNAIGTTYGVGDGSTTFNLPDTRGRFPLGKATAGTGSTLGGTGGLIDHVHALDSATSHARVRLDDPTDQLSSEVKATANWTRNAGVSVAGVNNTGATDNVGARLGGNSDVANPPFQTFNYQIKT